MFDSNLINVLETQIKNALNHTNQLGSIMTVSDEDSAEKVLYKTMKHIQYIMKFIIRSRILFGKFDAYKDKALFEMNLESMCSIVRNI